MRRIPEVNAQKEDQGADFPPGNARPTQKREMGFSLYYTHANLYHRRGQIKPPSQIELIFSKKVFNEFVYRFSVSRKGYFHKQRIVPYFDIFFLQ